MYFKLLILIVSIFAFISCEPLEVGDPPSFTTFTVTPVNDTQVAVRWNAGSDPEELIPPEELTYAIWFVAAGEDIGETPNIVTERGALSHNITGLTAATAYDVLVRASDGPSSFSANENTVEVTTPAEGAGPFQAEIFATLPATPDSILAGNIFDSTQETIGVVTGTSIAWYIYSSTSLTARTDGSISVNQDIDEAHAVRFRESSNRDDLFLLTSTDLYYVQNDSSVFESPLSFAGGSVVPEAGSVGFYEENGVAQAVNFTGSDGIVRIMTLNEDDDVFETQAEINRTSGDVVRMADFNNNGIPDYVRFGADGLWVALDDDEDYQFVEEELIDDETTGSSTATLFLSDGDGDTQLDIYIFLRNISTDETIMREYQGDGNGTFTRQSDADFAMAFFDQPSFQNYNFDGRPDLIVPQSSANNVAILTTPFSLSATNTRASLYVGSTADNVTQAMAVNVDNQGNRDVVLMSRSQSRITVLARN